MTLSSFTPSEELIFLIYRARFSGSLIMPLIISMFMPLITPSAETLARLSAASSISSLKCRSIHNCVGINTAISTSWMMICSLICMPCEYHHVFIWEPLKIHISSQLLRCVKNFLLTYHTYAARRNFFHALHLGEL